MSIQKVIEYQKVDAELYKLEKAYEQSKEKERVQQCINAFNSRKDILTKLVKDLDDTYASLTKLEARFDEVMANKAGVEVNLDAFETMEQFADYEKVLTKFEDGVQSVNREFAKLSRRAAEISAENTGINTMLDNISREHAAAKNALDMKRNQLLGSAKPITEKLRVMGESIDPKLFEKYRALRASKKMPACVPIQDGNCLGCGMNIQIEVEKKLTKEGDWAECPNCGRIVYKRNG